MIHDGRPRTDFKRIQSTRSRRHGRPGPSSPCYIAPLRVLRQGAPACAAGLVDLNVNDQHKMQDSNNWYSLQRSNADQNAYSIQDPAPNTSTLAPAGFHDAQALPSLYSFASTARPTHGEGFSPSLYAFTHYLHCSGSSPFSSIHGRTLVFLFTASILQRKW